MEALGIIGTVIAFYLAVVIFLCVKDGINIFEGLRDFFLEWWDIIKTIIPPLIVIVILIVAWFGN